MKKLFKNNKGFTLVELIIVIAIIAILAAVLAPQFIRYVESSRQSNDVATAKSIETAVNVLVADGSLAAGSTVVWDTDAASGDALTVTVGTGSTATAAQAKELITAGKTLSGAESAVASADTQLLFTVGLVSGEMTVVITEVANALTNNVPAVTESVDYNVWATGNSIG